MEHMLLDYTYPTIGEDELGVEDCEQQQRQDEAEKIVGDVEVDQLIERIVAEIGPHQRHQLRVYAQITSTLFASTL